MYAFSALWRVDLNELAYFWSHGSSRSITTCEMNVVQHLISSSMFIVSLFRVLSDFELWCMARWKETRQLLSQADIYKECTMESGCTGCTGLIVLLTFSTTNDRRRGCYWSDRCRNAYSVRFDNTSFDMASYSARVHGSVVWRGPARLNSLTYTVSHWSLRNRWWQ